MMVMSTMRATFDGTSAVQAYPQQEPTSEICVQSGGRDLMYRISDEWLELCKSKPYDQPFYRPEWIDCYLSAFGSEEHFVLVTARISGRLVAVLPLMRRKTFFCGLPVRKLQGAANVHSVRFDLIANNLPEGDAAIRAIWSFLRRMPGWDVIELPSVPESGAAEKLLRAAGEHGYLAAQYESMRSPYISIAASKCSTSRSRRSCRKAQATWNVQMSCTREANPDALKQFFLLENSGWKGKRGTSILSSAKTVRYYQHIARVASESGYFALYLLSFDGTVVAGHFGVIYGGRYHLLKCAYLEDFQNYCPGHVIVGKILEDCRMHDLSEFDFTGPTYPWKTEWTSFVRPHASCYIFHNNPYGRILHAARLRVRPFLKRQFLKVLPTSWQ
jgi:CelD/BcsL family acetyltransferase involved in cellulose biosynthesis